MKIIITGEPHSGKSTLVADIVGCVDFKRGFVTREVREYGERTGFQIVTNYGHWKLFASIHVDSPFQVSRYKVDVDALDSMLADLDDFHFNPDELLYIDEIGQMQLYSEAFKRFVRKCLDSENEVIATLTSVHNDAFTDEIRSRGDVTFLHLTSNDRRRAYLRLRSMFNHLLPGR